MALLNYTTKIAVGKTAAEIVAMLAKAGARQVLTDYGDRGQVEAISFAYAVPNETVQKYRLPVDVAAVEKVMRSQNIPRPLKTTEQAERVAWRILKDWVEAQLAILETGMVVFDQVMLPYMLVPGGTFYELFRDQQLAIGPGAPDTA